MLFSGPSQISTLSCNDCFFRGFNTPKDFWDSLAYCMHEGGRLISPEAAQFIDSDLELEQLKGGLYRTSAYWSESEKFWFDAANLIDAGNGQSGSPFSQITEWGEHIEPRLCIADGPSLRRYVLKDSIFVNDTVTIRIKDTQMPEISEYPIYSSPVIGHCHNQNIGIH